MKYHLILLLMYPICKNLTSIYDYKNLIATIANNRFIRTNDPKNAIIKLKSHDENETVSYSNIIT